MDFRDPGEASWFNELKGQQIEEDQKKYDAAGPPIQGDLRDAIFNDLSDKTRQSDDNVNRMIDDMNAKLMQIDKRFADLPDPEFTAKEAIQKFFPENKDKFVKNVASEISGLVKMAVEECKERAEKPKADGALEGSKFATGGGDDPKTESPRRAPSKGPGGR